MGAYGNATPLLKPIFPTADLTLPKRPPPTVMDAYSHATPPLLKAIFSTTDLTWPKRPPSQNFMGANCNTTPLLKIFLITTDLTWPTLTPPPKFHGCNLSCYTCVNILDLCRFDLTYLTPPPKFHRCNLLHYTCVKWYFRSMQIWLDIFNPPQISQVQFVMLHLC